MHLWIPFVPAVFTLALTLGMARAAPTARADDATRGLALLQHFADSLPRNGGNTLRCTSCHLDDGRRESAMPWVGVTTRYPKYRARRGAIETIEQRVNECITRSLAGRALAEDGRDMRDMVSYLHTLQSTQVIVRPDSVRVDGDPGRGAGTYKTTCARCHGPKALGALSPAVAGRHSFSIGAGMARQRVLATFIRWNMPHDMPGTLAVQDAADIAAWVLRLPRPDHPGKERDWPNGDVPIDVAYATDGARVRGLPLPAPRPLLRRMVASTPPTSP